MPSLGSISTAYSPGSVRTDTSYGGGGRTVANEPFQGGQDDFMNFLKAATKKRVAGAFHKPILRATPATLGQADADAALARGQQASMRTAQYQAATGAPPMRMVTGPGVIPGYMPDVNRYTGIQRQAYLPAQAEGAPGFSLPVGRAIEGAGGEFGGLTGGGGFYGGGRNRGMSPLDSSGLPVDWNEMPDWYRKGLLRQFYQIED